MPRGQQPTCRSGARHQRPENGAELCHRRPALARGRGAQIASGALRPGDRTPSTAGRISGSRRGGQLGPMAPSIRPPLTIGGDPGGATSSTPAGPGMPAGRLPRRCEMTGGGADVLERGATTCWGRGRLVALDAGAAHAMEADRRWGGGWSRPEGHATRCAIDGRPQASPTGQESGCMFGGRLPSRRTRRDRASLSPMRAGWPGGSRRQRPAAASTTVGVASARAAPLLCHARSRR